MRCPVPCMCRIRVNTFTVCACNNLTGFRDFRGKARFWLRLSYTCYIRWHQKAKRDPKSKMSFSAILSTEGRVVGLCWEHI